MTCDYTTDSDLKQNGFSVVDSVLDDAQVAALIHAFDARVAATAGESPDYAMRDVLNAVPLVQSLLQTPSLVALAQQALGPCAFVARCLFFDKVAGHNWPVGWHQDTAIAVKQRVDTPGFGPWSVKAGAPHTKAPASVLQNMCAIRLHLDDCPAANGALRCVPGSHAHGVLQGGDAMRLREQLGSVTCEVKAGGAVLMKPLTLHASSPADEPRHRRVIHLECACEDLPGALDWHERWAFG